MRITSLNQASTASASILAVAAAVVPFVATGCGPSELARGYATYIQQVEPVLEQESSRWGRLTELLLERQENFSSPRYYTYLTDTALPFYTDMSEQVAAMGPDGERLQAAHAHLVRFAEARLEFVHVESSGREVFQAAVGEGGLVGVLSGLQDAENIRYEYQEAVGQDVPDAKLGELYTLVDTFRRKYFDPMQQGALDPREVQTRLRTHMIPSLEGLLRRKYEPNERGRLLKACVSSWLQWHVNLEKICPLLQRVWQIKAKSEAAAKEAQESLDAFKLALEEIRRDR